MHDEYAPCESFDHVSPSDDVTIWRLIMQLAEECERQNQATLRLDLATGLSGRMLFFAHLALYRDPHRIFAERAIRDMRALEGRVGSWMAVTPGLFTGISGICWAMRHVAILLDLDEWKGTNAFEPVCDFVYEYLSGSIDGEFDLINGFAGIGVWGLSLDDEAWRLRIVGRVLDQLSSSALPQSDGAQLTWATPIVRFRQQGRTPPPQHIPEIDLGMSHGIAGVVGFLALCIEHGVLVEESTRLLAKSTTWLLRQVHPSPNRSLFPLVAGSVKGSRLAWCYGDLGILAALDRASRVTDSAELSRFLSPAVSLLSRRRFEDSAIRDGGFCHGASGILHVCTILAARGWSANLSDCRDYWLSVLIGMQAHHKDLGMFPRWNATLGKYERSADLLTGAAGIGLTLLTHLSGDHSWAYPFQVG